MSAVALSKNEVKRLKAAAAMAGERETLIILFGMMAGLRAAEIASLKNSDVFDSRGRTRTRFTLECSRNKNKKPRTIFIHADTCKAIGAYSQKKKLFKSSQPLLEGQRGRSCMAPNTICQIVKRLFADADIENNSSHALRKTFGTFLRKNGCDLALIQEALGHSGSIAVTKRYLGITDTEVSSAIANLRF